MVWNWTHDISEVCLHRDSKDSLSDQWWMAVQEIQALPGGDQIVLAWTTHSTDDSGVFPSLPLLITTILHTCIDSLIKTWVIIPSRESIRQSMSGTTKLRLLPGCREGGFLIELLLAPVHCSNRMWIMLVAVSDVLELVCTSSRECTQALMCLYSFNDVTLVWNQPLECYTTEINKCADHAFSFSFLQEDY